MSDKYGEVWQSGTKIVAQSNGHLECTECSTYWCDHIEHLVKNGLDGTVLIEMLAESDIWNMLYVNLEVPVVPTLNIWAPVRLVPARVNNVPMFKVIWPGPNADLEVFLGYLSAGEGRSIIRSMVFDYFNGAGVDPSTRLCNSPRHGYTEEMRFQQDLRDQLLCFASQWTIWYEGACLACRGSEVVSGSDPDLVPDAGSTASPWAETRKIRHLGFRNVLPNPEYQKFEKRYIDDYQWMERRNGQSA